ncbi:sensor histidine kinase [Palleronia sp. LCG004]|uniref:sensor histidine kinase n=1 Tax=Palleronia sp. LCG004 TaxID=3079304 RepID=UPI0029438C25|nr:sensor histidine kinase [Palleronia sp. LCG004]WOI58284.1 sensor histidine kinase [Palleronia sp. LCG004]
MKAISLRLRLFLVILPPLFAVAVLLGWWRFEAAQRTSEQLFDRSLLSAALAISRDVAISEGDALSPGTRRVISDAGGGELFYHVTGPGGIYVTGYAYPPRPDMPVTRDLPFYYFADYRGERMRVVRIIESRTIGTLTGDSVVTVWQRVSDRRAFAQALALRAAALMAALLTALALIIWFGVQIGLRPLNDLQSAIRQRSPDDLGPIRRPVPAEVSGIVSTLNHLLAQLQDSIEAHQSFISDAAHQLRNPAAAILTLAETLPHMHDPADRAKYEKQLVDAARRSARLAEQLLSLERLRYDDSTAMMSFDVNTVVEDVCQSFAAKALSRDVEFTLSKSAEPLSILGNPVLVGEALINLLENALKHGGAGMSAIWVRTSSDDDAVMIRVQDDGVGIPPEKGGAAFRRFSQLENGEGTGLGLAIVEKVMGKHAGRVDIEPTGRGAKFCLRFPRCATV